jgi:hypothetical protein
MLRDLQSLRRLGAASHNGEIARSRSQRRSGGRSSICHSSTCSHPPAGSPHDMCGSSRKADEGRARWCSRRAEGRYATRPCGDPRGGADHGRDDTKTLSAIQRSRRRCTLPALAHATGRERRRHGRQADEVRPARAPAGRWHRRRKPHGSQSLRVHADRDQQTAAPRLAPHPPLGLRRRLRARGPVRVVRDGGGRRERHPARHHLHARPSGDVPGVAPGRHAADAARNRRAADDAPPRRFRGSGQRRQPGRHAGRVRPGRYADGPLHEPVAGDAGLAALVP